MPTRRFAPDSRAGRIGWRLEEPDILFELNRMDFDRKGLRSAARRARHPPGRVPLLDDGDVRLYGSGAIVEPVLPAGVPFEQALEGKDYLIGGFSAADCMLGHSCIMASRIGMRTDEMPNRTACGERLLARPACAEAFVARREEVRDGTGCEAPWRTG